MQFVRFVMCGMVAIALILATLVNEAEADKALWGLVHGFKKGKRLMLKKHLVTLGSLLVLWKIHEDHTREPIDPPLPDYNPSLHGASHHSLSHG